MQLFVLVIILLSSQQKVPFSLIIGRLVLLQKFVSDPCISSELTNIMQVIVLFSQCCYLLSLRTSVDSLNIIL